MDEFLIEAPSLRLDRNSPEEKSAFQERMSKARDLALGGLSPRAAGEQRVQKILHWVYAFEKSTIPILEKVGGSNQYGKVQKLIERGFLRVQNSKAGGFDGVSKKIVTLTVAGLDYVERHTDEMYRYRWAKDPSGLNQNHLLHDLIAQILTVTNLQQGRIKGFEPESRSNEKNLIGKKKPDVIWHMDAKKRWGLEVELTKKTGVTVDDIAKRLMDHGFHAPTVSFPVAGTMMIEPTESEDVRELDRFISAMESIRGEIAEIEAGEITIEESALRFSPHTIGDLVRDDWDRKYSREKAAFPTGEAFGIGRNGKYLPTVGRIDGVYGDRNLVCSCLPIEELASN